MYSVESASSAMPRANLPRVLAVAGATSSSSAASARLMCRMSLSPPSAHWSTNTGWCERASKVRGATKRVAASRHHDVHVHAALLQLAQHLAGLVGPDAAGDAEDDRHGAASSRARPWPRPARPGTGRLHVLAHLPGDGVGQHLLDGHAGGLAGLRLHPRLGPVLELLGALRGHGDEAELAVHVLGKNDLGCSCVSRLLLAIRRSRARPARRRACGSCAAGRPGSRTSRPRGTVEVVVHEHVVVGVVEADLVAGRVEPAARWPPSSSWPRPRSRLSSSSEDGGRMKTLTASSSFLRTCCAPCTSTSSTRSTPSVSARRSSARLVP